MCGFASPNRGAGAQVRSATGTASPTTVRLASCCASGARGLRDHSSKATAPKPRARQPPPPRTPCCSSQRSSPAVTTRTLKPCQRKIEESGRHNTGRHNRLRSDSDMRGEKSKNPDTTTTVMCEAGRRARRPRADAFRWRHLSPCPSGCALLLMAGVSTLGVWCFCDFRDFRKPLRSLN